VGANAETPSCPSYGLNGVSESGKPTALKHDASGNLTLSCERFRTGL